jgi:hypothetical protein
MRIPAFILAGGLLASLLAGGAHAEPSEPRSHLRYTIRVSRFDDSKTPQPLFDDLIDAGLQRDISGCLAGDGASFEPAGDLDPASGGSDTGPARCPALSLAIHPATEHDGVIREMFTVTVPSPADEQGRQTAGTPEIRVLELRPNTPQHLTIKAGAYSLDIAAEFFVPKREPLFFQWRFRLLTDTDSIVR